MLPGASSPLPYLLLHLFWTVDSSFKLISSKFQRFLINSDALMLSLYIFRGRKKRMWNSSIHPFGLIPNLTNIFLKSRTHTCTYHLYYNTKSKQTIRSALLPLINGKPYYFCDMLGMGNLLTNISTKKSFSDLTFLSLLQRKFILPDKELLFFGLTAPCYCGPLLCLFPSLTQPALWSLGACIGPSWDFKFSVF